MFPSPSDKPEGYTIIPYRGEERMVYKGYRFCPTDDELVNHYLLTKARGLDLPCDIISQLDLYSYNPDQLAIDENENEAYFFTYRPKSDSTQKNHATPNGYWKEIGNDEKILHDSKTIAYKKKLVYYSGTSLQSQKTGYMMVEYRLNSSLSTEVEDATIKNNIENLVLCKVLENKESAYAAQLKTMESGASPVLLQDRRATCDSIKLLELSSQPPFASIFGFEQSI